MSGLNGDGTHEVFPSERQVITEIEILSQRCPTCSAILGVGCKNKFRHALSRVVGAHELSFHNERVILAYQEQLRQKFAGMCASNQEKAQIVYYAFIKMANAVSANAIKIFGKEIDTTDIQKFFTIKAIEELDLDKCID